MASTDLITLVVAVVGVAGTMGAPWLSERSRRAEARDQAAREKQVREEERQNKSFEDRRELYAALNSTARTYRSALRNCAWAVARGEAVREPMQELEAARSAFKDQYSQAQMVLPDGTLAVSSAVNSELGYGYKLIRNLLTDAGERESVEATLGWLRGPLAAAVVLLREALRQDLGVIEPIQNLEDQVLALQAGRTRRVGSGESAPHDTHET